MSSENLFFAAEYIVDAVDFIIVSNSLADGWSFAVAPMLFRVVPSSQARLLMHMRAITFMALLASPYAVRL